MQLRAAALLLLLAGLGAWSFLHAQKPFREYDTVEGHAESVVPEDANIPHEWTRARLMYRESPVYGRRFFGGNGSWTIDYPRSDRHLLYGVKRLTLIDARSVEQAVALDGSDDIFNWPMLYAVEVGHWDLDETEAAQLREYINRGGFLMVDDFHGTREWDIFVEGMNKVFPDREIVDLPNNDPIFHVLYDLDDKYQIPGAQYLQSGRTYEQDGYTAKWRGIFDDKGRIVVAICHNMDLGDAWEWSDEPAYPAEWANMAYRIGMNYFVYDLTH